MNVGQYLLVVTKGAELAARGYRGPVVDTPLDRTGAVLGAVPQPPSILRTETAILQASDGADADQFGSAVALEGGLAAVGAPDYDSMQTDSGAVYLFSSQDGQWSQVQKLLPSSPAYHGYFGYSLALHGSWLFVGAVGEIPLHSSLYSTGAVYVFHKEATGWVEYQRLTAVGASSYDNFGVAIATDGQTAIIGASGDSSSITSHAGSACVFSLVNGVWVQTQKLTAADPTTDNQFGSSVALDGARALVGAAGAKAAYVFDWDETAWRESSKLLPPATFSGNYGRSVALEGDMALVGSDYAYSSQAVLMYERVGGVWSLRQVVPLSQGGLTFSAPRLALQGDTLLVGAYDGTPYISQGVVFVLRLEEGLWVERQRLMIAGSTYSDNLGQGIAIDGQTVLAGADGYYSSSFGSGAACFFQLSPPVDVYSVDAVAGDVLTASTVTPADGNGEFANGLDPVLDLYDPSGAVVASDDNGAPDGRNARLTYTAAVAGRYLFRVRSAGGTSGEFLLTVSGFTAAPAPFQVVASSPAAGALLGASPASLTVTFSDLVYWPSVSAADLTVDGVAATGVTAVDGRTATFSLPALSDGTHTWQIAAGALTNLQGQPLDACGASLTVDTVSPRVIASSVTEGQVLPIGNLTYVAAFDEPLAAGALDVSDATLVGLATGAHAPTTLAYDALARTLTLGFADLPEDTYTLTLLSGDGKLEDLAGNNLDGEADPATTVPSGNGTPGGDFVVHFATDRPTGPAAFTPVAPLGSLAYTSFNTGALAGADDIDDFLVSLQAGETVAALFLPLAGSAILTIEIPGLVAPVTAGTGGAQVALPLTAVTGSGQYVVRVSGDRACQYELTIYRNTAAEVADTTAASPLNIGPSVIPAGLGADSARYAVLGMGEMATDAYTLDLIGSAGKSIDVLLTAQSGTDLSGATMTLLAPGGVTVLATAVKG
ncbi:MAG: pre-peptidase C-terminal domain-containing protein, partial [Planctomycetota bacterium]|nr:pre-peptidase C-terminal domain-containing protein [Planctomycetota bacterium]